MDLGHILFEELRYEAGQPLDGSLIEYRVPLATDLPERFETLLVEAGNGPGSYGAKGIGEGAINTVAPAVATAVARACGVWRALRDRRGMPRDFPAGER